MQHTDSHSNTLTYGVVEQRAPIGCTQDPQLPSWENSILTSVARVLLPSLSFSSIFDSMQDHSRHHRILMTAPTYILFRYPSRQGS